MQDFFKFISLWSVLASPATQKVDPLDRYFTGALVDVMEVRTTRVHDPTYQQIRESFRDPMLRF